MNLTEVYNQIKTLYESFETGHNAGTKKGAKDARMALGQIKKLVTDYRKSSVESCKK